MTAECRMTNDECLSVDDPRHPLQMDLEAAKMAVRKWRNIGDEMMTLERRAWAAANRSFHEGRVEGLKRRIAGMKKEGCAR